jgi:predicted nucleic acid-binding protein
MKLSDVLHGCVAHTEERINAIWDQADICLDTNVLLDVYRFNDENRAAFIRLLGALKGRLFIPHQVVIEYARNRVAAISGHFQPLAIIKTNLETAAKKLKAEYAKHPLFSDLLDLIALAEKSLEQRFGEAQKKQLDLIGNDTILPQLLTTIGGVEGDAYPEADAQREFKRRQEGNTPPYCKKDDADKDDEKRKGDVVIWLELLKKYEGKKKPIIFVTDDMKENWWLKSGGKHMPQPALLQEAHIRIGGEMLFYTSARFNETAPGRLGVNVPKGLAEETQQIRAQENWIPRRLRILERSRERASQEKTRVFALARELNMEPAALLTLCRLQGIDIRNQLSTLEKDQVSKIMELYFTRLKQAHRRRFGS